MSLFVLLNGKTGSFLIVNGHYNPALDFVCKWWTYMGDGIMWVPLCLYCIVWKRDFFWTTIVAIIISTLITHLFKDIIFPGELRPIHLLTQNIPVHTVPGVKMNTVHSFPSGHTAQAFTMALLLTYMIKKRYWAYILPFLALGV
ncbi:MAG: phosphatase PAP2 family protein, partial [Bacteroidetes bacterium]|nr:phosphatase PAP2 family protein [Bacteroidota bacterium]